VLRLGFSSAALYTHLPAILRAFRWRYPQVVLNLFERSSEQQVAMLADGALDAAVVRLPIENTPRALAVKSLLREPLLLATPRRHRLANRTRVPVTALNSEPLIIFPRHVTPGLYDQIAGLCREAGFALNVAQEAAEISTIVSLVSVGLGIAIVPNSVRNLQRAMISYRELVPSAMTELALAYDKDNNSAVLRSFVETVEQRAQN
jgi:DNA-binding transcriptional LysR family regulator